MDQKACVSASIGLDFISQHMSQAVNGFVKFYNDPERWPRQRNESRVYLAMQHSAVKDIDLDLDFELAYDRHRRAEVQVVELDDDEFELSLPYPIDFEGTEVSGTLEFGFKVVFERDDDEIW